MSSEHDLKRQPDEAPAGPTRSSIDPAQTDAEGRPPLSSSGVHRKGVVRACLVTVAAAATAAAVIGLSGVAGASSLLDRADTAINVRDQVLHEVDIQDEGGAPGYRDRVEGWLLPADGRARMIRVYGYRGTPFVSEWIITATGRAFARSCLSHCHPASFIVGHARWASAGRVTHGTLGVLPEFLPGTFAAWFRTAHRDHAVIRAGTTTFAGNRVARFESMSPSFGPTIVFWRPGTPPPASARHGAFGAVPYTLIDWYVQSATAHLVGFRTIACATDHIRSCRDYLSTLRIVTFQRLEPHPAEPRPGDGPERSRGRPMSPPDRSIKEELC